MLLYNGVFFFKDLEPPCIDWSLILKVKNKEYKYKAENACKSVKKKSFSQNCQDFVFIKPYKLKANKSTPTFHHVINITEKTPTSTCQISSSSQTFKNYYRHRYGIKIVDNSQHLIETYTDGMASYSKPMRNITLFNSKMQKSVEKFKHYQEYLVPEICSILPLQSLFLLKVLYLPVILYRMKALLLAQELKEIIEATECTDMKFLKNEEYSFFDFEGKKNTMASFPYKDIVKENEHIICFNEKENNNGPSPALILTALTLKCAKDVIDLERAEFLGDSYLKLITTLNICLLYPEIRNKEFNNLKDDIVNNQNLYKLAVEQHLEKYLITCPFEQDKILPCFVQSENAKKCETLSTTLSYKKVADSIEALIAIYLLYSGQNGALLFLKWLGLNFAENITKKKIEDFKVIAYQNTSKETLVNLNTLEEKLLYSFKNKSIISMALSPSQEDNFYRKLPIIGNCILDYLISRYLYEDENFLDPSELTKGRSTVLRKKNLAYIALKYKFYEHIKILPESVKMEIIECEKSNFLKDFKVRFRIKIIKCIFLCIH